MAESNYLEDRTVQLAKRVELLLNRLPAREQGQEHPPEATKLRQITSFNQSLAKELESIKAECQEKLESIEDRSLVISQETESLRIDKEALQQANEENLKLRDSLQKMLNDASSERSLLADERKDVGCKATDLTQREQALQAHWEQLERDRKAGDTEQEQIRTGHQKEMAEAEIRIKQQSDELEQSRVAHENKVKEAESRIKQQSDELERSRVAHDNKVKEAESQMQLQRHELAQSMTAHENKVKEAESRIHKQSKELEQDRLAHISGVAEDRARSQTQSEALAGRQASMMSQLEEMDLQRSDLIAEHQKLDTQKREMLLRSAETAHKKSSLEDREKKVSEREERLTALQDEVTAKDGYCKDFIASHNSKVELWEKWCADLVDKRKQIDAEERNFNLKKGTIAAIQTELTREREDSQALRAKLGEAESKLAAQGAEVMTQKQASAEHGKGLNEILKMLHGLSVSGTSMNSATDVIRESTKSVNQLEKDLSSKLMAHDAVERDLEAAQAIIVELRKDVSAKDEAVTRLEEQLSVSHKEKSSAEEQVSALEEQLSASEEQKTSAEQDKQKTTHDLSERDRDIENLRGEIGKLQEQVQHKTTELCAATDELKVLERDIHGERERAKSMAHYRVSFHVEEDRHKTETKNLIAEHQRQIQQLNAEHGEAVRALEARHSREIDEPEGLLSRHQRTHRRSLPLLTPSTTRSASLHGEQPQATSEWQRLLDEGPTQEDEAHGFLRSIEPSIADEDAGNFSLSVLLPHIASMAPNSTKRERFEAYLQSNETDWFCFVLLGKLGHENQESRHTETRCTYRLHQENCIQVRLREDIGPRRIEFRTFHVE